MKNMTWGSHGPAAPSPRYPFFDSMKEKAPASGGLKLWSATAAVVLSIICCLVAPASTHSVRLRYRGSSVEAIRRAQFRIPKLAVVETGRPGALDEADEAILALDRGLVAAATEHE